MKIILALFRVLREKGMDGANIIVGAITLGNE